MKNLTDKIKSLKLSKEKFIDSYSLKEFKNREDYLIGKAKRVNSKFTKTLNFILSEGFKVGKPLSVPVPVDLRLYAYLIRKVLGFNLSVKTLETLKEKKDNGNETLLTKKILVEKR